MLFSAAGSHEKARISKAECVARVGQLGWSPVLKTPLHPWLDASAERVSKPFGALWAPDSAEQQDPAGQGKC